MAVSRRRFLGVAACAVPSALARGRVQGGLASRIGNFSGGPLASEPSRSVRLSSFVLADLGAHCALPESWAGFARGLAAASVPFQSVLLESGLFERGPFAGVAASTISSAIQAALVLIPGAVLRSPRLAQTLRGLVDRGATVVYESGAAYADSDGFATEQRLLARYFGLHIGPPVELWRAQPATALPPYVHYAWPSRVVVRDFSRACPVRSLATPIADCSGFPVACWQSLGRGEFVYLGSALGPHLNAGDPEALALLRAFVSGS
jgi:hypothetical protein